MTTVSTLQKHLKELGISKIPDGLWVSIDPATGASSLPAITFWRGAVFQSRMLLQVRGVCNESRLQHIRVLLEQIERKTVCLACIEKLAPAFGGKGYTFTNQGVTNLHQSCGVLIAHWDAPVVLITPQQWQGVLKNDAKFEDYIKTDLNDSTALGMCFIRQLGKQPVLPDAILTHMFHRQKKE